MFIIIALLILVFCHLISDRDFDKDMKIVAYVIFAIVAIWYLVTQIIF